MQLTGEEIIKQGLITNFCEEGIQQQGIDVRIDKIYQYSAGPGRVTKKKTFIPEYIRIHSVAGMYNLQPGYYEITLKEGVNIPDNAVMNFKTRSSLVRCGAIVYSGQFDAGFKTDSAGCFLHVIQPISIEERARIAQAVFTLSNPVKNLYDGQFQNDKQRQS